MLGNILTNSFRLIMLIPFLAAMGYGLLMTKFSNEVMGGFNALESGETVEPGIASKFLGKIGGMVITHKVGKLRDKLFDPDALGPHRTVVLASSVPLTDLIGPDLPAQALHDLYASARLPGWLARDCTQMLATLARSCMVVETKVQSVRPGRDGTLMVAYRAELAWTPADPLLTPGTASQGKLALSSVDLTADAETRIPRTDPDLAARRDAERQRIYDLARANCDAIRARKGSCAVKSIAIIENASGTRDIRFTGRMDFAWLEPVPES
jgi:hypothetical protein